MAVAIHRLGLMALLKRKPSETCRGGARQQDCPHRPGSLMATGESYDGARMHGASALAA